MLKTRLHQSPCNGREPESTVDWQARNQYDYSCKQSKEASRIALPFPFLRYFNRNSLSFLHCDLRVSSLVLESYNSEQMATKKI